MELSGSSKGFPKEIPNPSFRWFHQNPPKDQQFYLLSPLVKALSDLCNYRSLTREKSVSKFEILEVYEYVSFRTVANPTVYRPDWRFPVTGELFTALMPSGLSRCLIFPHCPNFFTFHQQPYVLHVTSNARARTLVLKSLSSIYSSHQVTD